MSNKFDFNKVTFKICSTNCLKYLELYKKQSEVKYIFNFEVKKSISSMGHKNCLLKTIFSIGEN